MSSELGTSSLRFEREGPIAWCVIDRPQARNALTPGMYYGIKRAVHLVNTDADLSALIITGTGDVFAPGGDLGGRVEPGDEPGPSIGGGSRCRASGLTCCRSSPSATAGRRWWPRSTGSVRPVVS